MEEVLGKLVARICYVSKKILEDIQNEVFSNETELTERFKLCDSDIEKTLQIALALRSSRGLEINESILTFQNHLIKFEKSCQEFQKNRFNFQLGQTVQSSHKELAIQLNIILGKLDSKSIQQQIPISTIISNKARNVAMKIRTVSDLANSGEIESFVPTAKQAFIEMNELQQILIQQNEEQATNLGRKLGTLSIELIRTAKELCQNQTEKKRKDFITAKQDIAKHLQEILFFAQNANKQDTNVSENTRVAHHNTSVTETTIEEAQKSIAEQKEQKEQQEQQSALHSPSETDENDKTDTSEEESLDKRKKKRKSRRSSSHGAINSILQPKSKGKIRELADQLQKKQLFVLHSNPEKAIPLSTAETLPSPGQNQERNSNNFNRSESSVLPKLNMEEIKAAKSKYSSENVMEEVCHILCHEMKIRLEIAILGFNDRPEAKLTQI